MISETILPIKKRLYCLLQVWGPSQLFKNIREIYKDDVSVGFHCTLGPKDIIFFFYQQFWPTVRCPKVYQVQIYDKRIYQIIYNQNV